MAEAKTDGGESLAPHVARREMTAIERSDDENKPTAAPAAAPAPAAASTGDAPAAAAPSAPATQPIEEVITTEDIIIEIDD
jgi:hypothetical protein